MNLVDGRQLRAARAILGLTVQEMAALVGVNRNTIWRVERIKKLRKNAHAARLIANAAERRGITFEVVDDMPAVRFRDLTLKEWLAARQADKAQRGGAKVVSSPPATPAAPAFSGGAQAGSHHHRGDGKGADPMRTPGLRGM